VNLEGSTPQQVAEMKDAVKMVGTRGFNKRYASAAALINSGIQRESNTGEDQVQGAIKAYLEEVLADKKVSQDEKDNMLDLMRAAGRKTDKMIELLQVGNTITDDQTKQIQDSLADSMPEIK
jgi:hypothetical protein